MRILSGDPVTSPFNEFLKNYGMYVAIGVAAILLIIVITLLLINKHSNTKDKK